MEIDAVDNSNWLFDYGLMEDISSAAAGGFAAHRPPATVGFGWPPAASDTINSSTTVSVEFECSYLDSDSRKEAGSQKRLKTEPLKGSCSKAGREKMRRDKLNERFLELSSVLEPGRPPKTDKTALLSDAVRMLTRLRNETQKLNESNEDLQEKIKELKAEKNELRDEKQRLKAEKENLEQQVKSMSGQPGYLPHPSAMGAAFAAQAQAAGNKLMPFVGYPGVAMWQFMQPAVVDTSQDHVLRPPVA